MSSRKIILSLTAVLPAVSLIVITAFRPGVPADQKGAFAYKDFEPAQKCRTCHVQFYEQWSQSMMSQAFTHHWDEIEYFELAVPHAEKSRS